MYRAAVIMHGGTALFLDDPRVARSSRRHGATKAAQTFCKKLAAETAKVGPRIVIANPGPDAHRHPRAVLSGRGP
jgi:hypothetical protein